MVFVMPNKFFSKNTNQLCSVWKMVWITGNMTPCSILKKLNIIWNLMILKDHLIYNKSDRNIISTMSPDVVTDAFSTINERIQSEKEKYERHNALFFQDRPGPKRKKKTPVQRGINARFQNKKKGKKLPSKGN